MAETGRQRLLREAIEAVEARGAAYGPPAKHFARTCGAANAILGDLFARPITPADWARLMVIDKLARDAERAKVDNCLDIAGYAACLAEIRHYGQEVAAVPEVARWTETPTHGISGLVGEDEG